MIRDHRWLALTLVLAAFAMKALVPGGYMVAVQGKVLTVAICGDGSSGHLTAQLTIPMQGDPAPGQGGHAKAEGACPYSALSFASLGGSDPVLLALALAFIVALGLLPRIPRPLGQTPYLRPPLRGPPVFA